MKTKTIHWRKKATVVLITAGLFVWSASANAQAADARKAPEERAKKMTDKMKTELSLTDEQYTKVQEVNVKYATKNESILNSSKGKFEKYRAIKSSQGEKKKELKKILDKEQFKKYEDMLEEMEDEAKSRYKNQNG